MPVTIDIAVDASASGPVRVYLNSVLPGLATAGQEVAPGETASIVSDSAVRGVIHTADPADSWSATVTNGLQTSALIGIARDANGQDMEWDHGGEQTIRPRIQPGESASASYVGNGELHLIQVAADPKEPNPTS